MNLIIHYFIHKLNYPLTRQIRWHYLYAVINRSSAFIVKHSYSSYVVLKRYNAQLYKTVAIEFKYLSDYR